MIKLNLFFKYLSSILFLLVILLPKIVFLQELVDDRIKKLTLQLRCMTCQNQTVHESESEFSKDIIKIIKNKLKEGKNEQEIKVLLVERYGEYILFKPEFNNKNLVLWLFPFVLFSFSFVFFIFHLKKK